MFRLFSEGNKMAATWCGTQSRQPSGPLSLLLMQTGLETGFLLLGFHSLFCTLRLRSLTGFVKLAPASSLPVTLALGPRVLLPSISFSCPPLLRSKAAGFTCAMFSITVHVHTLRTL